MSRLTGPFDAALSASESDTVDSVGDLFPQASIRWNRGLHNFMAYTQWGIPVGSYSADRLANIGTNHWSADAGGGYT